MGELNVQIKEREQEYRINELKIKELRRQLPAKVLKPLDAKLKSTAKHGLDGGGLPPVAPQHSKLALAKSFPVLEPP